jgi:hypothetical protein
MKYLPILLGAAAIYGFMNGWGASFGLCPPGYTAAGGECTNSLLTASLPLGVGPQMPTTVLPAPQMWAQNSTGAWVAITPTPVWP